MCILSAVNVGKIKNFDEMEELCDLSVRALDELIDYQHYPVTAAETSTKNRRSLGIGYIGLAHFLAKNGLKYSERAAAQMVHDLTEAFQYYLLKSSNELAKEKGACGYFNRTKYSDGILPIDTYKKDVDDIVANELKYDWEGLREISLDTVCGKLNTVRTDAIGERFRCVKCHKRIKARPVHSCPLRSRKGVLKQIVPQYTTLKNVYTLLWDMESNHGYINIVAVMQKFFDQAISGNWSYNPETTQTMKSQFLSWQKTS